MGFCKLQGASLGSVHNLRPGGPETIRRNHLFNPASAVQGSKIFLACGQGRPGKILTASKGGSEFFFALHLTKSFPKRAQKHLFTCFRVFLAHYVFLVEPTYGGGTAFIFHSCGGGPGFLDKPQGGPGFFSRLRMKISGPLPDVNYGHSLILTWTCVTFP